MPLSLDHAISVNYKYICDWTGNNYCGLTFEWNYEQRYVDIYMPGYVEKSLSGLQHTPKIFPQYSPHAHIPIVYATKNTQQYTTTPDKSPLLNPKDTKFIQSVTGSFLYYRQALDNTILPALNEIALEQAQPTQKNNGKSATPHGLYPHVP